MNIKYSSFFLIGFLLFLFACDKKVEVNTEPIGPTVPPFVETCEFIRLKINGATCAFDAASSTFYFPISINHNNFSPLVEVEETDVEIFIQQNRISNNTINNLGEVKINEAIPIEIVLCDESKLSYQLLFTQLPIIQIEMNGQEIKDNPKIAGTLQLNEPNFDEVESLNKITTSIIGIEVRGGSSQFYDKKAYAFELWSDNSGAETKEEKLLDIRKDDDWILDGMSNDNSRMRNRVSMDIWRNFSQLPYHLQEPKAKNGTSGKLVELFIDTEYRGIYALSDRVDRKLLKLKKIEDGLDFGMLYKSFAWGRGVVTFKNYYDFDASVSTWEGWEQKYPDPEKEGIFWEPIADFTKFVVTASDDVFIKEIASYLDLDNAIDYFIFLNLIRGDDNTGKNIYMAKYDKISPFVILPWDVDATWGLFWDRTRTNPSEEILSNHLFNRLLSLNPNDFRTKLKDRWRDARSKEFTQLEIMSYFNNYSQQILANGSFDRERRKWEVNSTLESELAYIDSWIGERLVFLDDYFSSLAR